MSDTPIKMTEAAAGHINLLVKSAEQDVLGVRLSIVASGCSGYNYYLDYILESDEDLAEHDCLESNDAKLYTPKVQSPMMAGMNIDFSEDELGNMGFEFTNPNESSHCGCGESFQVDGADEADSEDEGGCCGGGGGCCG